MHNTRLSIFILPVLIIGLSIFTTFVEENPSFRSLFQISQVANPSVNEEGQDLIDRAESEHTTEEVAPENTAIEADITDRETTQDEGNTTREENNDESGGVREQIDQHETQKTESTDVDVNSSSESTETSNQTESSINENKEVTQEENQITEEQTDKEIQDAELLALKISQFEVARSNISYKLQINLSRLESARNSLAAKITQMEQNGKDTTQAKDALMNLDQAIKNSRHYIKDSTKPESISGIQRVLTEYVKNARDSIQEGYNALFQAIQEAQ